MAVTLTTAAKNAVLTGMRDHFAGGTLEILTAADALLVAFDIDATTGGSVASSAWTLAFDAGTVAAGGTGTAAKAQMKTSGAVADMTGLTVGTSGTDVVLDNTSIASGQNVTLSSAVINHP